VLVQLDPEQEKKTPYPLLFSHKVPQEWTKRPTPRIPLNEAFVGEVSGIKLCPQAAVDDAELPLDVY
jgi:hypothetical protein